MNDGELAGLRHRIQSVRSSDDMLGWAIARRLLGEVDRLRAELARWEVRDGQR